MASGPALAELRQVLFAAGDVFCRWTVRSLVECTSAIQAGSVDALLVDLSSLSADPSDLVRAIGSVTDAPIIAIRGLDAPNPHSAWIEYGFAVLAAPVTPSAVRSALDAVRRGGVRRQAARHAERADGMDRNAKVEWLVVHASEGWIRQLPVDDVLWIEADQNGANIRTRSGSVRVKHRISTIAHSLPPERFVRIHRTAIVNLDALRAAAHPSVARRTVKLVNGVELTVSPACWENLVERMRARAFH